MRAKVIIRRAFKAIPFVLACVIGAVGLLFVLVGGWTCKVSAWMMSAIGFTDRARHVMETVNDVAEEVQL